MRRAEAPPSSVTARAAVLALILLLAGCTTVPEVRIPETVRVPVPVPCISHEARPQRPALRTEADLMAMDSYRRTLAAWSELLTLRAWSGELEAVVEGCARIPAARGPP